MLVLLKFNVGASDIVAALKGTQFIHRRNQLNTKQLLELLLKLSFVMSCLSKINPKFYQKEIRLK